MNERARTLNKAHQRGKAFKLPAAHQSIVGIHSCRLLTQFYDFFFVFEMTSTEKNSVNASGNEAYLYGDTRWGAAQDK